MMIRECSPQNQFLIYTFAANSIASAVCTRNKLFPLYRKGLNDNEKEPFKKFLLSYTQNLWADKSDITKADMLEEIEQFTEHCTKEYSAILHQDKMRLGIAQKLITLMTKFLWVNGQLKTPPPIIPYDGIVKGRLRNSTLKDWTALDDMQDYKMVLEAIDIASDGKPAEWELEQWNGKIQN